MDIRIATTETEINKVYDVRKTVFVKEQQVPLEIEIDEHEQAAIHFICYQDESPVGASRLRFMDEYGKLERICVIKEYRGHSIGKQLIHQMEQEITRNGYTTAKLNAQTHAIDFYRALGYEVVSDEFMDAGIPHMTMTKQLSSF